jgi:hypothetical protein
VTAGLPLLQLLCTVTKKGVAFKQAPVPEEPEEPEIGGLGFGVIAAGLISNPIVLWSAWTLKNTGKNTGCAFLACERA